MAMQLKTLLSVLFATALVVANITAAKVAYFTFPLIGGVAIPAGFVAIGVAFLFTDLIGELYGKEHARNTVNATVAALVFAWALIYVSIAMPAAPFYELSEGFGAVLGGGATIITASIVTTLVSQNVDVSVFHYVREYTNGRHKWTRNLSSTGISQFVDTALFIILGFALLPHVLGGSVTPWSAIPGMILGQYAAKLLIAGLDTPVFYAITKFVGSD